MPPEAAVEGICGIRPRQDSRPAGWVRTVFSFPAFLCFTLILLNVLTVASRFNDPDLWWHLRIGEVIWTSHSIPHTDTLSSTTGNHAWVPHEWLSELSIYAAFRLGGYFGLMVWLCACASAVSILVYVLCALYSGHPKIALAGALVAWFFGTVGLAIRPLLPGHMLLVIELILIWLGLNRSSRWFWALPPLFAVWVNCHGTHAAGLMVLAAILFCANFELDIGCLVSTRRAAKIRGRLWLAFGLCAAALFLNPSGVQGLLYPLNVFTAQTQNIATVEEWRPLTVTEPRGAALIATGGILFLMVLLRRVKLRAEELLLFTLGFFMALRHTRMLFVFGILAAPILCRLLADAWGVCERRRDRPAINAAFIAVCIAIVIGVFPGRAALEEQVTKGNPTRAVAFIRQAGLRGRMLNDYTWGGYLIWALPEHKAFIDGRADVFEWTGVFQEYARWANLEESPNRLLDKWNVEFCLLRKDSPVSLLLSYVPGWKRTYADDQAYVFVRTAPKP